MNAPDSRIQVQTGDITKIEVDAIVNAANSSLLGGGGVDGAIHRAGGKSILAECKKITAKQGGCKTGDAVITTAGNLPAKFVIHTVGPVWHGGDQGEATLLSKCYFHSMKLAWENACKTIAFPNISTGVYGYPRDQAALIAVETVSGFLKNVPDFDLVVFVCFERDNYDYIRKYLEMQQATPEN